MSLFIDTVCELRHVLEEDPGKVGHGSYHGNTLPSLGVGAGSGCERSSCRHR